MKKLSDEIFEILAKMEEGKEKGSASKEITKKDISAVAKAVKEVLKPIDFSIRGPAGDETVIYVEIFLREIMRVIKKAINKMGYDVNIHEGKNSEFKITKK